VTTFNTSALEVAVVREVKICCRDGCSGRRCISPNMLCLTLNLGSAANAGRATFNEACHRLVPVIENVALTIASWIVKRRRRGPLKGSLT
jgi:hypothetical protein